MRQVGSLVTMLPFSSSFLGLLHMEVFLQRLEDEHAAKVISTPPTGKSYTKTEKAFHCPQTGLELAL